MVNPDAMDKNSNTIMVEYIPAEITIFVYDARDRGATVKGELDRRVDRSDIKVIERSSVTIDGISGEQAAYTSSGLLPLAPAPGQKKTPEYDKTIIFEQAGLMWLLEYYSEASLLDQVESDFNNIVQTFKILE
jgi:hypothetical protein